MAGGRRPVRDGGGQCGASCHGGGRHADRDGRLDRAEVAEQGDPVHGGALHRRWCAGWPQRCQQQRRFAQVGPAAILPVLAVSAGRHGFELSDQGGRIGWPVLGVFGHPGGYQWS
jgi:hypothetical protein